jgi:hypothetical protein
MKRIAVLFVSAAINATTIPAVASECKLASEIAASRAHWASVRSQAGVDHQATCHAYAASFYESVMLRQAAVACVRDANREQNVTMLDSEIDAFNDLLAARCRG